MSEGASNQAPARVPFRAGFLAGDFDDLGTVRLAGSRCGRCGIALLGRRRRCENCASSDVRDATFSHRGTIYSYTVQRYPPPQPHAVPAPWFPRALAWIDLSGSGPRVMGVIAGDPDRVRIGADVEFGAKVGWLDREGREVVDYQFRLSGSEGEG